MFSWLTIWQRTCLCVLHWGEPSALLLTFLSWLQVRVRLEALCHFPIYFGKFIGVNLVHLTSNNAFWVQLLMLQGDKKLTANFHRLWLLKSFCPLFSNIPWVLGVEVAFRSFHWGWAPQLDILICCGFLQ